MRHVIVKSVALVALLCTLIGIGLFVVTFFQKEELPVVPAVTEPAVVATPDEPFFTRQVIGSSREGREIEAYTYGNGDTHLLFVGGIHGGYEWNSVLLAYEFIDYLESHPEMVADTLKITIVPSANPDGVYTVVGMNGRFVASDVTDSATPGLGRFNAKQVDLNRNFDCKWKPESMWRGNVVSAGTAAFSEPESIAIRDFVVTHKPAAVVFWHSQSNAVYASECENGVLADTRTLMNTYASAAGYPAVDSFDAYEITGDAEGWLASIGIPAITVELKTHETIEWEKNLAGMEAVLLHYELQSKVAR